MTPADIEVARSFVACPGWAWMAGMRTLPGSLANRPAVVLAVDADGMPQELACPPSDAHRHEVMSCYGTPSWGADAWSRALPDVTDPGTLGCITEVVRRAWAAQHVSVGWFSYGVGKGGRFDLEVVDIEAGQMLYAHGPTPAAALLAALQAAPVKETP